MTDDQKWLADLCEVVRLWELVVGDEAPLPQVEMQPAHDDPPYAHDDPPHLVRCGECGAVYSYTRGHCLGCGRN